MWQSGVEFLSLTCILLCKLKYKTEHACIFDVPRKLSEITFISTSPLFHYLIYFNPILIHLSLSGGSWVEDNLSSKYHYIILKETLTLWLVLIKFGHIFKSWLPLPLWRILLRSFLNPHATILLMGSSVHLPKILCHITFKSCYSICKWESNINQQFGLHVIPL